MLAVAGERVVERKRGRRSEKVSQKESDGLSDILERRVATSGNRVLLRLRHGGINVVKKRSAEGASRIKEDEEKILTRGRMGAHRF
jgi:hypothetical protein